MSEENKALARQFYEEIFNKKNLDAIDELCAPDFVDHNAMPGQAPGSRGLKDVFATFFRGLPDLRITVHELVAEGDIVVVRLTPKLSSCDGFTQHRARQPARRPHSRDSDDPSNENPEQDDEHNRRNIHGHGAAPPHR